jgi:opacity protein-like surface antigen
LTDLFFKTTNVGTPIVSSNSVDPLVGIGVAWHLTHRMALRAEYTRFVNVGDKHTTGEMNIDFYNLGVTYSLH